MSLRPPNSLEALSGSSPNAAAAPLADGEYRYEIRRDGKLIAIEEECLAGDRLTGVRRSAEGSDRHEVEASFDANGLVSRLSVRYSRGPFARSANFEAADEFLRGTVSALGGRDNVVVKLGRFREVDGDLILFKAIIIAHTRARGLKRFTGRVATIDPNTLMVASHKQTYAQSDSEGLRWNYEPRMGDSEKIEMDRRGVIVRRVDSRGDQTLLVSV